MRDAVIGAGFTRQLKGGLVSPVPGGAGVDSYSYKVQVPSLARAWCLRRL